MLQAYDFTLLPHPIRENMPRQQGWCFGLPPGITPEQWPLDPNNGFPLNHGFTFLLPEDYRIYGPEIIALSFFSVAREHNDGGTPCTEEVLNVFEHFDHSAPPEDHDLYLFWLAEKQRHPRLFRMEDSLGCSYAVILLTLQEFDGPFCEPPELIPNYYRDQQEAPAWISVGNAFNYFQDSVRPTDTPESNFVYRKLGTIPEQSLAFNLAISCQPRTFDPNAGISPTESNDTEYQSIYFFYEDTAGNSQCGTHRWHNTHQPNHLGGSMSPVQSIPNEISPYYIEFEEYFGGYNFAAGNAWLDLKNMKFDFSC
ncbi:MAG: hypothetical protein RSA84_22160 [Acinetobacter sp.]